jgi:hypothetical protein
MRWHSDEAAAPSFDQTYFAPASDLRLQPVEWGDGAMATFVFAVRLPWVVRDYTDGSLWRPDVEWARTTSIFYALFGRKEQPGNSMHVIRAADGRVLGCVSLVAGPGPSDLVLEFMLHPNSAQGATEPLRHHLKGRSGMLCFAAPEDLVRRAILRDLGFHCQAGLTAGGLETWKTS